MRGYLSWYSEAHGTCKSSLGLAAMLGLHINSGHKMHAGAATAAAATPIARLRHWQSGAP